MGFPFGRVHGKGACGAHRAVQGNDLGLSGCRIPVQPKFPLFSTQKFHVNFDQQLRIQQGPVIGAVRIVNVKPFTQGIQIVLGPGKFFSGNG